LNLKGDQTTIDQTSGSSGWAASNGNPLAATR
jgi:hypothetical protein